MTHLSKNMKTKCTV